jgi:hypothetical protein
MIRENMPSAMKVPKSVLRSFCGEGGRVKKNRKSLGTVRDIVEGDVYEDSAVVLYGYRAESAYEGRLTDCHKQRVITANRQ